MDFLISVSGSPPALLNAEIRTLGYDRWIYFTVPKQEGNVRDEDKIQYLHYEIQETSKEDFTFYRSSSSYYVKTARMKIGQLKPGRTYHISAYAKSLRLYKGPVTRITFVAGDVPVPTKPTLQVARAGEGGR